jgi:hypothetical protein
VPTLKLPTFAPIPGKPARMPHESLDARTKALEDHVDRIQEWAVSLNRSLTAWSKQLDDLFNRGSVKRLQQ